MRTRAIEAHDPKFNAVTIIPHVYPTHKPTQLDMEHIATFRKFVGEIVGDSRLTGLIQAFGYTLSPVALLKALFFLYGPTNTGKSQIIRFLVRLVGRQNAVSVDPHSLAS